jgi:hypothetical protein
MYCVNSIPVANLTSYFLFIKGIKGTASTAERSKCWKRTNSHVIIRKKHRSADLDDVHALILTITGWAVFYEIG